MYKDYQDALLHYYRQQKGNSSFSNRLAKPTPAGLRTECGIIYKARFDRRDTGTLATFFEQPNEALLSRTIDRFDINKFRPLVNFLKGRTSTPTYPNVELLAWILEYPDRPWDRFNARVKDQESGFPQVPEEVSSRLETSVNKGAGIQDASTTKKDENDRNTLNNAPESRKKRAILSILIFVLLLSGVLFWWNINTGKADGCILWVTDHFESISCDSLASNRAVEPMDEKRLNGFRRINRPDTLTRKDIGKVWYQKRPGGLVEFYTQSGIDPLNPEKDVKRMTKEIFINHLEKP